MSRVGRGRKKRPASKSSSRMAAREGSSARSTDRTPRFVGRSGSPVLDKYPPKAADAAVSAIPPRPAVAPVAAARPPPAAENPAAAPASSAGPAEVPRGLISLERPFDPDDFAQLLGQNQIRVTVPRDQLVEVLRRICDFMGFGIYVYTIRVRPAAEELLRSFVVELERVDFSSRARDWEAFQDRGQSDSPFGPGGRR